MKGPYCSGWVSASVELQGLGRFEEVCRSKILTLMLHQMEHL